MACIIFLLLMRNSLSKNGLHSGFFRKGFLVGTEGEGRLANVAQKSRFETLSS